MYLLHTTEIFPMKPEYIASTEEDCVMWLKAQHNSFKQDCELRLVFAMSINFLAQLNF